jgi:hypothetical protein
MAIPSKRRSGGAAGIKAKQADDNHILLARGLSARYLGANVPLSALSAEEMERDLRHMEAFANACTAYSQQYFIFQNAQKGDDHEDAPNSPASAPVQSQPLISMPVRIDPEEEKRLMNLRQKIQRCEAQREVLESQYLSLRAHYVYVCQVLKKLRGTVDYDMEFLQALVKKRGAVVALQRARLQMARDVLKCLNYRQQDKSNTNNDEMETEAADADLVDVWNEIDEKLKNAQQDCRRNGTVQWHALKVPKDPPGIPLKISLLSRSPGFAAAYSTNGVFGSSPSSMCWIESNMPKEAPKTAAIVNLREEVSMLTQELDKEHNLNRDLQTNIIGRRKRNDELVAMMALLRSETEAVVSRHNILLESDQAKDAAFSLHQENQELKNNSINAEEPVSAIITAEKDDDIPSSADALNTNAIPDALPSEGADAVSSSSNGAEPAPTGTTALTPALVDVNNNTSSDLVDKPIRDKEEDDENDGDDEGEVGEDEDDEDGEIVDDELGAEGAAKRALEGDDVNGETGSPRTVKRRKL